MTDWRQGYLAGYLYTGTTFLGTLTTKNTPAGFGPFTSVAYRIVEPRTRELEQVADMIEVADIVQAFEIWNYTISGSDANIAAGSYSVKQQDQFTGQGGSPEDVWNVKLASSDPLVVPVGSRLVRPTTRIVCTKQV